jgi:voltage-gated potassium channel
VAATDSDAENLFITLSARQLNAQLNIVSRALSPAAENKLLRAGANRVILPYKMGAIQLAQAALRPSVVDFIEIATRTSKIDLGIEELQVGESGPLCGKTLREAAILREMGLIVIGIRSGNDEHMFFNPSASTRINPGDTLITLGKPDKLEAILKRLR